MSSENNVKYELYEVISQVAILSEPGGENIGSLEVGEQVYARADTVKTIESYDRELMMEEVDTFIQHERGWSLVKSSTNDRDDGLQEYERMKLIETVMGSADEYPAV